MTQHTPAEVYDKDHINTMRSFLIRKGEQELSEWPTKDLPEHIHEMLDCMLEDEYSNAFHHQRILAAYVLLLADINRYGMHIALPAMVDKFFTMAQVNGATPYSVIMSDEMTREFLSHCQFMQ